MNIKPECKDCSSDLCCLSGVLRVDTSCGICGCVFGIEGATRIEITAGLAEKRIACRHRLPRLICTQCKRGV